MPGIVSNIHVDEGPLREGSDVVGACQNENAGESLRDDSIIQFCVSPWIDESFNDFPAAQNGRTVH